jgi:hypothetical protein
MSQSGYSIGRDTTVSVVLPDGTTLNFGKITSFDAKQNTAETEVAGIDGVTDHVRFYKGWTGTFAAERRGSDLDAYFSNLESNYFAGRGEAYVTIQQTITEPNGQVSQFRFDNTVLKYDDAGTFKADATVAQSVSFTSSRRIKQA